MAYTETDLANIESAILALATGQRTVRVAYSDKSFEFGQADLPQLRQLKAEIGAELGISAVKYIRFAAEKGL